MLATCADAAGAARLRCGAGAGAAAADCSGEGAGVDAAGAGGVLRATAGAETAGEIPGETNLLAAMPVLPSPETGVA